ncbi:DUF515 domain-containing protein [Thermococcus thioreducens]|uniref:DUF515 domain-containing protein n=1 Tax=Thermococcus thioreducens TaxID=277988 RepID=A0A0Q2S887_9EURY|nr:DUF515 domain-containing protein [Thermococcus thioreducens]ASJ11416.1 hypothetical protein A3L14_00285 [Thermococcus thioreducens]KQH83435.1 hypothetical protein AMR53_00290 [Thermococcus thioreducens]SEW07122.1 hypothetical protein SAMN05216170_1382 [Thermococcus thioreducens]
MSEDIEAKIRRLRELGKASVEPEVPKTAKPPVRKPPKKPRPVGSIRERERRKRILIGASIVILVILIISIGAYIYMENRAAEELTQAKTKKLAEVNAYFKPGSELMNTTFGKNARDELIRKINAAQTVEEVQSIDVKAAYQEAWNQYQAYLEEQKRLEMERQLNQTKKEKISQIEAQFSQLLAMPLPDDLKRKVVDSMNSLEEQVMSATTEQQVNAVNADPYLLELWREYYYYVIDTIPTQNVILERDNVKKIVTKAEAKSVLGGILDYRELIQYKVYKVEFVDIALVLSRDKINGAFLAPGDKIMIFAKNATNAPFKEIVNEGYVELVLLPTQAGTISVNEAQSQTSSSSTTSSTQYTEQHNTQYTPGDTSITNGQAISDIYTNSQTASQSASASYSYTVDLTEILKAIAAGKIQASEDVKEQLRAYGWEIVGLEKESGMLVLDPNTQFLVIVKVPSIFVPDILSNQQYLYIAKVAT